jgi:hypothetical protein
VTPLTLHRYVPLATWNAVVNKRYARGRERFLIVNDPVAPFFYNVLLDWLASHFPEIRARFELHTLPTYIRDWSRYSLHVPWLQDPVQATSPSRYRLAVRLAERCDEHGIPIVNRVERLTNATKSRASSLIAKAGLRTARMARIEDEQEFRETRLGIPLPLLVREDWGHQGHPIKIHTEKELRALQLGRFRRPVAVEFIDVRGSDGLYRKYRYVVAGEVGVPQSLHVSRDWCVRGSPRKSIYTEELREEEIAYLNRAEPHHERFVAARAALGLDFVAFDYSIDTGGEPVVWEANPFPYMHLLTGRRSYRAPATERALAAMARLYLERAGSEVPERLMDLTVREMSSLGGSDRDS